MAMIRIDCREISGGDIGRSEPMRRAYDCFVKSGYAILDKVIDAKKVQALRAEFDVRYDRYLEDRERAETLEVGKRRFLVPIEFAGGFADPSVYANPFVVALVREVLDCDAILNNFGAVVSLSGAEIQHGHRDAAPLFDSGISALLPAHAMTVVLPLVDMNDDHGTTAIWPGSHRWKTFQERDERVPPVAPVIPVGSAYMWDYRLFHRGTANVSGEHRPMIYGTYARCWYRDAANFKKETQRRLWFGEDFIQSVPKEQRPLFARVA